MRLSGDLTCRVCRKYSIKTANMSTESTPLLQFPGLNGGESLGLGDHHNQFCHLIGVRPVNLPPTQKHTPHPESLYCRAVRHRNNQGTTYVITSTLVNTLLLSQVVLGAALTGLGASDSSRVLITVFGALNTVIAGLVAFLKSRGQPMRARMFRDDLERVVDEIENSAVMWLGISRGAHGYNAIDTDDQVTVRSEIARLTRLYDRAVKTNTMNDPDMYAAGAPGDAHNAALRSRPGQSAPPAAPTAPVPASTDVAPAPVPAVPAPIVDPDASPASKPPEPKDKDKATVPTPPLTTNGQTTTTGSGASTPEADGANPEAKDDSPASAAKPPPVYDDSSNAGDSKPAVAGETLANGVEDATTKEPETGGNKENLPPS